LSAGNPESKGTPNQMVCCQRAGLAWPFGPVSCPRPKSLAIPASPARKGAMPRTVYVWSRGDPEGARACLPLADALPELPAPRPLGRSLEVASQCGEELFHAMAVCGELVTTGWGEGLITWLYLKAAQSSDVRAGEPANVSLILIPARYIVSIAAGPTYTPGRSGPGEDLGVFSPTQPTPEGALLLADLERVLAELHAPGLN
jgi:hypothetical protein